MHFKILFRSPHDCQHYFLCVTGKPRLYNCGEGSAFNELINSCDGIENVTSCAGTHRNAGAQVHNLGGHQQSNFGHQQSSFSQQQSSFGQQQSYFTNQQSNYRGQQQQGFGAQRGSHRF